MTLFGILNVNKPAGCSSRHVVDRIERHVRPAKVGHAGTLDPLATGVLVICVGQATRLIPYVQRMPKQYQATFLLGHRSETDDIEGEVTVIADAPVPTRAALDQMLPQFLGEIQQVPPAHSAVKVAGRRAYKLARAGKTVELVPRTVTIHRLAIRRYAYPALDLEIECGSGTYVRALGRDLAEALSTGAVMSALERTAIGAFHVADALALDEATLDAVTQRLQPALTAVADLPRVALTESQLIELRHGRPISASQSRSVSAAKSTEYAAVNVAGRLVAILREKRPGELWPDSNFV
ncbi:MAG: tRNA pseudouridine(55) synthase TruB [Planctomycetes bacterium]|nr:tRNA pseudouridine(55) synthase TruB [Planctomycetota bacterium]